MARLNSKWIHFGIIPVILLLWCIDHLYLAHLVVSYQLSWLGQVSKGNSALASNLAYQLTSPDLSMRSLGENVMKSSGLGHGGISLMYQALFPSLSFLCLLTTIVVLILFIAGRDRQEREKYVTIQNILHEFQKNNFQTDSSAGHDPAIIEILDSLSDIGDMLRKEKSALVKEQNAIRQYTENMLHQLKTPLTGISLIQEWLCSSETDSDRRELLLQCGHKIQDMQNKLRDLLYELKISSVDRQIHMKRQDISHIFNEIPLILAEQLNKKHINLNITCPDECNAVADYFWLKEALLNLCKNAIDYTAEKGNISLVVTISSSSLDITIRDDGIGIENDLKPHLFERYVSGSETTNSSGIGLNLAYEIIHRHGGSLLLEEHDGPGAWFLIRIPNLPGKGS